MAGRELCLLINPTSLEFHPQAVNDSVDEGVVGRHCNDVVNREVIESICSQPVDVRGLHTLRGSRQLRSKIEHLTIYGI